MSDQAVSVLMPVYNGEASIAEAIRSIQRQTHDAWELLICNDGSSDGTSDILEAFAASDPRISIMRNDVNRGLTYSLNRLLGQASFAFLARQDADDVSHASRLAKQVAYLNSHPDISLVSCSIALFDGGGVWGRVGNPLNPSPLDFIKRSPFAHAAVMMRSEAVQQVGGYRDIWRTHRVEDYDLWFSMYKAGHRGANLPVVLYDVLDDRGAYMRRTWRNRMNETLVRLEGYRGLRIPWRYWPTALRPLAVGLVPGFVYTRLRRDRYAAS